MKLKNIFINQVINKGGCNMKLKLCYNLNENCFTIIDSTNNDSRFIPIKCGMLTPDFLIEVLEYCQEFPRVSKKQCSTLISIILEYGIDCDTYVISTIESGINICSSLEVSGIDILIDSKEGVCELSFINDIVDYINNMLKAAKLF